MKLVLAKWTADRISAGNLLEWSAQEAMNYLKQRLNGHGGIIVLNPKATSASLITLPAWPGPTRRSTNKRPALSAALTRAHQLIGNHA